MPYSRRTKTERQIAIARAFLAAFVLAATWFDAAERAHHTAHAYELVIVYAVYAVALVPIVLRTGPRASQLQFATHAIDIAAFSTFMYLTDGPTSLLSVFFVFTLITATMRWQWRGPLGTAAITITIFLAFVVSNEVAPWGEFARGSIILGVAYLLVAAWLLALLGLHDDRLKREVGRLAVWSVELAADEAGDIDMDHMLARVASTMQAPRVLLTREDDGVSGGRRLPSPSPPAANRPPAQISSARASVARQ